MTQARESQAEIDGRKALLLVEFMTRELVNDEEGNANDFLDEVIQRLDAAGFLADAQSRRPRTALPASERAAAALGAVRDIAHTLRDPDEEVNSSDFVDGVARRLAAAGLAAESTEPIKRRVYVDGVAQVEDGLFVASSEDEAIALWQAKSGRFDVARSRLVAKKPCAKCGGPITHPQLAGDEAEVCARCMRSDGSEVTPMSAEPEGASGRRTTFKALAVGAAFVFASETETGWQGARGPWTKTSARKYRRKGSSDEILVGSIAVAVIEQPESGTGGRYRCWVVAKRRPHSVDEWYVDDRKSAVAEVKRKVREFRTEGGVDSQDPRHPLEVTWSLRRNGTLIETKF